MSLPVAVAVQAFLEARRGELGLSSAVLPQTPVFEGGLLDSLALIELVASVERSTGQAVDMLRFDPSLVESVADLVRELDASLVA